ncbi:histone deacetylase 7 [Ictalurus furcatus]|uniref:histone deacetylase 7 n=1 Tax=Ictalurus furcatus TaxID=66913 RepID=UPI00234FC01E|nr:histone deacetylase 7 [Ictalurus furcatus]
MDLRVGERVMRPGSDTLLSPLLLSPFNPQHCAQYNQHVRLNMQQHLQDQEQTKQQLQMIRHKDKRQQSAVASSVVKKKLAEVIRNKQKQAALERTSSNPLTNTPVAYRELAPDPNVPLQPLFSSPPQTLSDGAEDPPLRRATSEPNLKMKLKKHLHTRKSPLTRKQSAPPTIKPHRPDPHDSSPSSSSTPVSGCSSPNDTLPSENGVLPPTASLTHEAQRVLFADGSVAHFSVPTPSNLPTITLGLPAHAKMQAEGELGSLKLGRVPLVSSGSSLLVPLGVEKQNLVQPVIILEPSGLVHTPMLTVPGLAPVPLHVGAAHKPLSRTRSEPLPPSPHAIHTHLLQQQHNTQLLERLKQQTHLGKLMSKSSEKPRLCQIPSEDMDSEDVGTSSSNASKSRAESQREAETQDEHLSLQQTLILNQSRLWETQKQLQQLRRHTAQMVLPMMFSSGHRPLSRTQSSPASTSHTLPDKTLPITTATESNLSQSHFTTGLVYDSQMLKHQCTCGDNSSHPEHAGRIQSIWSRLQERGLRAQCESIRGRKATLEELQSVHTERHVLLYGTNPLNRLKLDNRNLTGILSQRMFVMLPCGGVGVDNDTIWNEMHTSTASRTAAGSVTELAFRVAKGELKNGFAVVRPPGHHADPSNPITRFHCVRVCVCVCVCVCRTVVIPIAQDFSPDLVLVSAGFDAAEGHPAPLGGYRVTAKCFGFLTQQLMKLAGGRVVLALEGGHDLTAICDASESCVSALLGLEDPLPDEVLNQKPNANAVQSLQKVLHIQSEYWPCVREMLLSVSLSYAGAQKGDSEETAAVKALASLSVGVLNNTKRVADEPMEDQDSM